MAIYHFSAKMISRANGSSALAAAAYRSASRLHDQRLDRHHDFSNKAGVVHSEVMLPDDAPEDLADRERLWNAVEAVEVRKDAQLAREIEFAIPRELDQAEGIRLARDYVKAEFVDKGMIADLNVHWDIGADGSPKPHAHVMLTTRSVDENGFGPKVRKWNATALLERWRERWGEHVNTRLAELDIDARVDHRTLDAQGIDLEPQHKIGPAASRMAGQNLESERLAEHVEIARSNGAKIIANPSIALDAITHGHATFTNRDLAMFMHRHSDGKDQFDQVMAAVRASPDLIALGKDGRGENRFTSRDMVEAEERLERATMAMAERSRHGVGDLERGAALARAAARGMTLSAEQTGAFEHVTEARDLGIVIGYAGTGKSAMLGVARDAWETAGYRVTGLTLSGIAAESLENGTGITSRTIASIEHRWARDRDRLTSSDVLIIDEAGLVGTRQLERLASEAVTRGAKLVLLGDPEQLQAIEAGAAFRWVHERHGGSEISEIRRQVDPWQREATRQLATGRTAAAIRTYEDRGHVHTADCRETARAALIGRWDDARRAAPKQTQMILTHTRDEVSALNLAARQQMRKADALGEDVSIETTHGRREFASGDRVMFLRNDRNLGVKNGSLGTVEAISANHVAVCMDDGRRVTIGGETYKDFDHGYASTIHKSQGVTIDRAHVLATPGLDRHAAYVALSRHKVRVDLHYGRDDFADPARLARTLARERHKDMASDYSVAKTPEPPTPTRSPFAGIRPRQPLAPERAPPEGARDPFAGLRIGPSKMAAPEITPLDRAVARLAYVTADISALRAKGIEALPHQRLALATAEQALDRLKSDGARDLSRAFEVSPSLIDDALNGRTVNAIRAMETETNNRIDTARRADLFVTQWQRLRAQRERLAGWQNEDARHRVDANMAGMGKALLRDPQVESLLSNRREDLGLRPVGGSSLSHDIQSWLSLSRGRNIGV